MCKSLRVILCIVLSFILFSPYCASARALRVETDITGIQEHLTTEIAKKIQAVEDEIAVLVSSRSIGFFYEALETGDTYGYNDTKRFASASTTKTPIVLCAYRLAAEGKLDLDTEMTYTSGYYYEGSGTIRYQPVGSTYTLRKLTEYAVHYSDNIAYSMLRRSIGEANLNRYINSVDGVFSNNFNSREISVYLKDLYNFANENTKYGEELLSFFIDTEYEQRIPSALPDLTVAHKVGMLPLQYIYNDSAIVYDESPYILVIMTSGANNNNEDFFIKLTHLIHKRHSLVFHDYLIDLPLTAQLTPPVGMETIANFGIANAYYDISHEEIMIPIGDILDTLKIKYKWDDDFSGFAFEYNDNFVFIFAKHQKAYIDMISRSYHIDIRDGKTYVPAQFLYDVLGVEKLSSGIS